MNGRLDGGAILIILPDGEERVMLTVHIDCPRSYTAEQIEEVFAEFLAETLAELAEADRKSTVN